MGNLFPFKQQHLDAGPGKGFEGDAEFPGADEIRRDGVTRALMQDLEQWAAPFRRPRQPIGDERQHAVIVGSVAERRDVDRS